MYTLLYIALLHREAVSDTLENPDASLLYGGVDVHIVHRNATEARRDFFSLLTEIAADPSEIVEVTHKDLDEPVLIVSAQFRRYVRQLERLVQMRANRDVTATPFRIGGTMRLRDARNEDGVSDARREQQRLFALKFADL